MANVSIILIVIEQIFYEFTTLKINFSLGLHNLGQGSADSSTLVESHPLSVLEIEVFFFFFFFHLLLLVGG